LLPDSSDPRFERVDWETFRCWWEKKERKKEKVGSELCITKNNNKKKVGCQISQLELASFPAIKIKTNKSMSECHITIMTQGGQSTLFMKLD